MGAENNPLINTQVTFVQHQVPGLAAGQYCLNLSQRVNDSAGQPIADDSLAKSYTFAVKGDRFRVEDPVLVKSVFPALNESGEFDTVLPHVVFEKVSFPWSRYPSNKPAFTPPMPPADVDSDVATWLAVLLFDADDVAAFPGLKLTPPSSATIGDLFPSRLNSTSSLGVNYSYFEKALATQLETGESLTDTIDVLDIPLQLFCQVAPTLNDLKFTAHVRTVSLLNKPTGQGADPGVPLGTFSIVVGTRLPQTNKKAYAYLVSLEQMESFLPASDQGGVPTGLDATRLLRLAVLRSWTFTSTGSAAKFTDGLLALNGRAPKPFPEPDAANTNLRLSYAGSNTVVAGALHMGYVPLNETLRTGEQTVSWYRGPLVPYNIQKPGLPPFPIASPDQALIFDPTTGMLDASYAAAWTLGRLIALQDTAFSTAFYTWKRGLSQQVVQAAENQVIGQTFANVLTQARRPQALFAVPPTESEDLLHLIMEALVTALGDEK